MKLRKTQDGKYRRVTSVKQDPLKVFFTRGSRKEEAAEEMKAPVRVRVPRNKSKVKLFRCVSMWNNPTSQAVSLETRMVHNRFQDAMQEINAEMFFDLKSSLDEAELLCSGSKSIRSIEGEDKPVKIEEIVEEEKF